MLNHISVNGGLKIKIEKGKEYKTESGLTATITERKLDFFFGSVTTYRSSHEKVIESCWDQKGKNLMGRPNWDLVEEYRPATKSPAKQ